MTLTTGTPSALFQLDAGIGQRSSTFRFHLVNGVTGENLGDLTPIRPGSLSHDTTRTLKRQLQFDLGVEDSAAINPLTDRVLLSMVDENGTEWPLGRHMFTSVQRQFFSSGRLASCQLNDEMFLVDQQVTKGLTGAGRNVVSVIKDALADQPIVWEAESSPYLSNQSWGVGSSRGQILEDLATVGDYLSPWFGNDGKLHFVRSFDPATAVPTFDLDASNEVFLDEIVESDNLLSAVNRWIVVSNSASSETPVVGVADVPPELPYSIPNRGFVVAQVADLQVTGAAQAQATARNLALRNSVFEKVILATAPDPRHDSYDVIWWQGSPWLETAWTMNLEAGGEMAHNLSKAYLS